MAEPRPFLVATLAVLALSGSGCKVGPDYETPEAPPVALSSTDALEADAAGIASGVPVVTEWWTTLEDRGLDELVSQLVEENLDLQAAMSRVREARALRGVAASTLYPQLDLGGRVGDTRLGEDFPASGIAYSIGFDARWELDAWGGLRRGVEAADATLEAALESRRDTLVSLLGDLGRAYVELRGQQRQLEIARRNVALQEKTLELIGVRRRSGLASDLEIAQVTRLLETTRATVPALERQIAVSAYRLGVLVGRPPSVLVAGLGAPSPLPRTPPRVPVGLASDLLKRRPDIRRAERQLAAASARLGVAKSDLYPRFALTGSIGYGSAGGLPGMESFFLGPTLSWPIFAGYRIVENIKAADARLEQAVFAYRAAILRALEEVEGAITAYSKEVVRRDHLARAAAEAEKAERFAQVQYRNGLVDFLNVIDAQSALATAQTQLVLSEQQVLVNLIALYKALGGGWDAFDVRLSERELRPAFESSGQ